MNRFLIERLVWLDAMPDHWKAVRLRYLAAVKNSNVDKKSYEGGLPVRLCNYTDVYYNEYIHRDMELMTATATATEVERFTLRSGDVIITKDSESWSDIGVPACVKEDLDGIVCGYHLTMLRPFAGVLHGPFLLRALQADGVRDQMFVEANGVTRYGLGQTAIRDVLIPVPPYDEQVRIADALDARLSAIDEVLRGVPRTLGDDDPDAGLLVEFVRAVRMYRTALITACVTGKVDLTAEQG